MTAAAARGPELSRRAALALGGGALALGAGLGVGVGVGPAMARRPLSTAEALIFDRPHLDGLAAGQALGYRFIRESASPALDSFEDRVTVRIDAVSEAGAKDLSFDFFSGERRRPYPKLSAYFGNPVVMLFLQRDVFELARLTEGSVDYLRGQVRAALRVSAEVVEGAALYQGRETPTQEVSFEPFGDPRFLGRLGPLARRRYRLIFSEAAPGWLLSARARTPAPTAAEEKIGFPPAEREGPWLLDRLEFDGLEGP